MSEPSGYDIELETVWLPVRTRPGGALVVWPETLPRTPWLINKTAGGPRLCKSEGEPLFCAMESVERAWRIIDVSDCDLRAEAQYVRPRVFCSFCFFNLDVQK